MIKAEAVYMDRFQEYGVLILYALAAISGGLGGCAVTAHQFISQDGSGKNQMRMSWLLAYAIIGATFGILFAAFGLFLIDYQSYTDIIGPSLIAGMIGSGTLGGVNTSARFVLKKLGVEVIVTVRKNKEDRRHDNRSNN